MLRLNKRINVEMKKAMAGIIVIIAGLSMLFFWEGYGKEHMQYEQVICASAEIQKGQTITGDLLISKALPKDCLISGAVKDETDLVGTVAAQYIPAQAQVSRKMTYTDDFYIDTDRGESIYKLPAEWIDSRSAAVRRGDTVEIYLANGQRKLGAFTVAYVKDAQEREVSSIAGQEYADMLNRTDATGVIDHIEIIGTQEEYATLYQVMSSTEQRLLIVQKQRGKRN
ncbi:MAG: hypothetical protein EOM59_06610 [Clostridia bacterium]|nr:hypothetical protein [Clostridia bacterium]